MVLAILMAAAAPSRAKGPDGTAPIAKITDEMLAQVFPGGGTLGPVAGKPPSAPVYRQGVVAGYVFSTFAAVRSVGFSGNPIDILVGLDIRGRITGAFLRHHNEPILVIGIPKERLARYVSGFSGLDAGGRAALRETGEPAKSVPDVVSGASVSSAVIRDAIFRSARAVARAQNIFANGKSERLDRETFTEASWDGLVREGSIVHRRITRRQLAQALDRAPPADTQPDSLFIDLYTGLITPPRVGENLIGKLAFNRLLGEMGVNDQAIAVTANGLYSFKGTGYVRSGVFDRVQLVQGAATIRLRKDHYRNVENFKIAGAPEFREIGIFIIPADTEFNPLDPWKLELSVNRTDTDGKPLHAGFDISYTLPERYRLKTADPLPALAEDEGAKHIAELWQQVWIEQSVKISALALLLAVLGGVLFFQDQVVRNPLVWRKLRLVFLAVVVVWLGWIAGGQLSVINVLTFIHSLLGEFHWEFFLLDPITFILWGYVAVTLLFWARGVFCGWLCPFGALQELLSEVAEKFNIPQIRLPFAVHERLWTIKYILFLGLLAVSFHSISLAMDGSEVEPFKTAISLKFVRSWPFVLYAAALLAGGLFLKRFFCRYLCPLGAALAIPARLRMFDWLKRRFQCGEVCSICADRCVVQAIHPNGTINPNECIHCLGCQTLYSDPYLCPPLIAERKRRERRRQLAGDAPGRFGEPQDA